MTTSDLSHFFRHYERDKIKIGLKRKKKKGGVLKEGYFLRQMGSGTVGNSTALRMFGGEKLYKLRNSGCLGREEEMLNTDKTVAQCLTQLGQNSKHYHITNINFKHMPL